MITPENPDFLYITRSGQERLSRLDKEGSQLVVEVLERLEGGRAKIRVDGKPFTARLPASYDEGNRFTAVVSRVNGVLSLIPRAGLSDAPRKNNAISDGTRANPSSDLARRLGLTPTSVVLNLIAFYTGVGSSLDPGRIRKISAAASRFPDMQEDAAEAAAMLERQGLDMDDESIVSLAALLRGDRDARNPLNDGRSAGGSRKEGDRDARWVIIPFRRPSGSGYSGSLRFLLNEKTGAVRGLCLGAVIDGTSIRIDLSGETPAFSVNPSPSAVILEKTEVYFRDALVAAGLAASDSEVSKAGSRALSFFPVDVRV